MKKLAFLIGACAIGLQFASEAMAKITIEGKHPHGQVTAIELGRSSVTMQIRSPFQDYATVTFTEDDLELGRSMVAVHGKYVKIQDKDEEIKITIEPLGVR